MLKICRRMEKKKDTKKTKGKGHGGQREGKMSDHIRSPSTDLPFSFADLCVEAQLGLEHQFHITGDQLLRISVPY